MSFFNRLREWFRGLNLQFSGPLLRVAGLILILLVVIVVVVVVVIPALRGRGGGPVAQDTPVPTIEVVEEAPSPTEVAQEVPEAEPTTHPWAIEPSPHPWSVEEPPATEEPKAEPSPTPTTAEEASVPASQPPAVQPTVPTLRPVSSEVTPSPTGEYGTGGGEELPEASAGFPWLIPIGVVLLVIVVWWRWRRARATG